MSIHCGILDTGSGRVFSGSGICNGFVMLLVPYLWASMTFLPKIRCRIRENAKYLDGIRDFAVTREAGFAKIWPWDAGYCCLSVGNSGNRHDPNNHYSGKSESTGERKISIERANLHLKFISFYRNYSF